MCSSYAKKRKAGKEAEKVGGFMAEFKLVVGLLSCTTGIRPQCS